MSRKLLITVILILFVLPFISWYYLKRGLEWRKQAQEVMNGTIPAPQGEWKETSGRLFSSKELEGHVTLVAFLSCDKPGEDTTLLNQFYGQFKETKKAHFIILNSCNQVVSLEQTPKLSWHVFSCSDSLTLCHLFAQSWPQGKTHALIDKRNIIRSYYASETKDDKRLLLEHMALLLPR